MTHRFSPQIVSKICVESHTFDLDFSKGAGWQGFLSCHVSGAVCLWSEAEEGSYILASCSQHHRKSCRTVKFFPNGQRFVTGSADGSCLVIDTNSRGLWSSSTQVSNSDPVNVLCPIDTNTFISGRDSGIVQLWDVRQNSSCTTIQPYEEVVFAIQLDQQHHPNQALITSGDRLCLYNIRYPKMQLKTMSDEQETDLLSCAIVKNGSKVLCGTSSDGAICIFDWNNMSDMTDRIINHNVSVDHIIPFTTLENNQDVIITSSGDGILRILTVFPHEVLCVIGMHNTSDESIEALSMSKEKKYVVSAAHDETLVVHKLPTQQELKEILAMDNGQRVKSNTPSSAKDDFFSDM
ncbi:WD repeat-containing protein 55-like [Hylaeus volcanicus]|uniref:WD repeat-containing protein 55-like n=1 Tax=Hylaeus volcanicus TaxID=313075 RepID=UPI0023B7C81B|nr:WD repeat-containing protein 55-like [Hylaeus volcanicus]XP_053990247.1 WD repeat-containing protein 55-like [Hylaeus volcanicus]